MLIFCAGVNLIWGKIFKTANLLPSVIIAVLWALVVMCQDVVYTDYA